jgi:hypothetical protein
MCADSRGDFAGCSVFVQPGRSLAGLRSGGSPARSGSWAGWAGRPCITVFTVELVLHLLSQAVREEGRAGDCVSGTEGSVGTRPSHFRLHLGSLCLAPCAGIGRHRHSRPRARRIRVTAASVKAAIASPHARSRLLGWPGGPFRAWVRTGRRGCTAVVRHGG